MVFYGVIVDSQTKRKPARQHKTTRSTPPYAENGAYAFTPITSAGEMPFLLRSLLLRFFPPLFSSAPVSSPVFSPFVSSVPVSSPVFFSACFFSCFFLRLFLLRLFLLRLFLLLFVSSPPVSVPSARRFTYQALNYRRRRCGYCTKTDGRSPQRSRHPL